MCWALTQCRRTCLDPKGLAQLGRGCFPHPSMHAQRGSGPWSARHAPGRRGAAAAPRPFDSYLIR